MKLPSKEAMLRRSSRSQGRQGLKFFLHNFLKRPPLAWNSIFGSKLQETCVLFIVRLQETRSDGSLKKNKIFFIDVNANTHISSCASSAFEDCSRVSLLLSSANPQQQPQWQTGLYKFQAFGKEIS